MNYRISIPKNESEFYHAMSLNGVDFIFSARWNQRSACWMWKLDDSDGNPLTGWRKIVGDYPLTKNLFSSSLPAGEIWCVTSNGVDPGLTDFGVLSRIMYVGSESVV